MKKDNNIIDADECMMAHYLYNSDDEESIKACMIEFATMHVEAALNEASKKAELKDEGRYVLGDEDWHENLVVDKQSILKSYPLTNIK